MLTHRTGNFRTIEDIAERLFLEPDQRAARRKRIVWRVGYCVPSPLIPEDDLREAGIPKELCVRHFDGWTLITKFIARKAVEQFLDWRSPNGVLAFAEIVPSEERTIVPALINRPVDDFIAPLLLKIAQLEDEGFEAWFEHLWTKFTSIQAPPHHLLIQWCRCIFLRCANGKFLSTYALPKKLDSLLGGLSQDHDAHLVFLARGRFRCYMAKFFPLEFDAEFLNEAERMLQRSENEGNFFERAIGEYQKWLCWSKTDDIVDEEIEICQTT